MSALVFGAAAAVGAAGALASQAVAQKRFTSSSSSTGKRGSSTSTSNDNNNDNDDEDDTKNVGIVGMECYIPYCYISQKELEDHSGVSSGKYTIGLGQDKLALVGDAEDINSISLTVVHSLLEK